MFTKKNQNCGVTLVELIVFIVVVSVALAGVLKSLEVVTKSSADPLVRKQALAIAESLLSEIEQQPFTYCDPNDVNASSATSTAGCTGGIAGSEDANGGPFTGPMPASESRYSLTDPFDNVADYGNFQMPGNGCNGICNLGDSAPLPGLNSYTASVTITRAGNAAPFSTIPIDAALKISIVVKGPANTIVNLTGYRFRYAPNI